MTTNTVAILVAITLSGGVPAGRHHASTFQDKKTDQTAAPGVAGRWTMSVNGGPHGDATMGLALEQKGKQVSGTFATPHGDDLQVQGEFAEGTLTIATPGGGDSKITMTAKYPSAAMPSGVGRGRLARTKPNAPSSANAAPASRRTPLQWPFCQMSENEVVSAYAFASRLLKVVPRSCSR